MTTKNDYAPGQCNIGATEIRRRLRAGYAGIAAFVGAFAALLVGEAAPLWHLVLFVPAFVAAIGLVQARSRFCVHFGLASLFNFAELGQAARVHDPEARRLDRAYAYRLIGVSAMIAVAGTLVAYLIAIMIG